MTGAPLRNLDQINKVTRSTAVGNIGSLSAFVVDVLDAELFREQLGGELIPKDLMLLPRFHAYPHLLINRHPGWPFTLRMLPSTIPTAGNGQRPESIRRYSRQRYGRPVDKVEGEIVLAFAG